MQSTQEVNVRVAVRVRPLLPKEKIAGEACCVKIIPSTKQLVLGKDKAFTFDHVLASKASQDQVFETCVDSLIISCFEGYNATVFAYGQTGSGKTYTVGGDNITSQTEEDFGIIPRAVHRIFQHIQQHQSRAYSVKISYIEIYKEELRDLLELDTSSKDMHIREDDKGNTLIIGISEIQCETMEEVIAYLEQGSAYRHTGSTQMNERSSRSHSIFTIGIEQNWTDTKKGGNERKRSRADSDSSEIIIEDNGDIEHYMCAKFHFVDLAGSERAHRTGNVGDRFKESVHINTGLLALGNVISALGDTKKKVSHIPYRDSKITRLLKDSLGGNANTVMLCCISPSSSNFDESLNALKYANRARNIKNKPIVNRDPQSIRFEEMQTEIKALRAELQKQRTSLVPGTLADTDLRKAIEDAGQIKELEEKLIRLQTECSHYRMIAEEAFKQLNEIQGRDLLSRSQTVRLTDWMDLMEEIKNKVPSTLNKDAWDNQTITKLERELKQCRNDLKSDEEIFAEKVKEVSSLQDRVSELEESNGEYQNQLEQIQEQLRLQQEQLVDKQVQLEELQAKLKENEKQIVIDSSVEMVSGPPTTTRRAKSVPVQFLGDRSLKKEELIRNIHTSPALFSLERVMQSFRARSQLLVSRLEDNDDVLQPSFDDDDVFQDSDEESEGIVIGKPVSKNKKVENNMSAFDRSTKGRSTYRVKRPKIKQPTLSAGDADSDESALRKSQTDDEKLSVIKGSDSNKKKVKRNQTFSKNELSRHIDSADTRKKKLKQTEIEVRQSTQKMRDLGINIKMKEQLIRELAKSSKDAQVMNKQYEEKIISLETEKQAAHAELTSLQVALQDLESRSQQDKAEKERLQIEFRKKMELTKTKIHSLQKKQKETERMATITGHNEKRIADLEGAIDKMRQQQDQLQKRLKEEVDHKTKMERDMQKEHQRTKELEIRHEQQKKVLKVKTEEMTAMQRRLRNSSHSTQFSSDEQVRVDDQKRFLDQEVEKVLEQRRQMESLEKELEKRADIIAKKEAMLAERSELEIKRLRSSQVLNKDIVMVSSKLDAIERQIEEKTQEMVITPRGEGQTKVKDDLQKLQHGRDRVKKQREVLDCKLQEGCILTPQEERRLIELEEAVEALDAAIEYRNEMILNKEQAIKKSSSGTQYGEEHFMSKLKTLAPSETKTLLAKYFEKVIDLRDGDRKKEQQCSELEMKVDEQERLIRELEVSLQRCGMEADRKLTMQQQEHERKIQVMMRQISENDGGGASSTGRTDPADLDKDAKIQELEKNLYYYKKTSRELKKKLREFVAGNNASGGGTLDSDRGSDAGDSGEHVPTPRELPAKKSALHSGQNHSRSNSGPSSSRNGEVSSARTPARPGGDNWDKLGALRDGSAGAPGPVRISRKDLRRMSQEEIKLRKSAAEITELPRDSLESGSNPWT